MKPRTFTELYSEREKIPPAAVPERLFQLALYPHARLVAGILLRVRRRHFRADFEFIEDVGYLRSLQDFSLALGNFVEHPDNRSVLRRNFRIRLSARRMLRLLRTVFAPDKPGAVVPMAGADTLEPFPERSPNTKPEAGRTPP